MKAKTILLLALVCCGSWPSFAQPVEDAEVLPQEAFLDWVAKYHPVAKQGRLLNVQAEALERLARGGFDPKLYGDYEAKTFGDKNYYAFGEGGVKVPTWYGVELKAAFAVADMDALYQNAERNVPDAGQAILGFKVPLGRGLIIDDRRAALSQAKLMAQANEIERRKMVNDLLLDAAVAYWDWSVAYSQLLVFERALEITEQRFDGIVESFRVGDLPAIDTLETMIQVQNRDFDLNNAQIAYRNATLQLSNFLWTENGEPLEITDELRPRVLAELANTPVAAGRQQLAQTARQTHPDIRAYEVKLQQLDIDRRLASEQFKPRLDVTYNLLGDGTNLIPGQPDDSGISALLAQNYKWGVQFDFPLFLRKERGKIELTRIKIQDAEYHLQRKRLEIANKVNNLYNQQDNLLEQIELFEGQVDNYQRLLNAEYQKFDIGESSIFLLNSREQKLIEAQLKLTELRGKFFKSVQKLLWAAGRLGM